MKRAGDGDGEAMGQTLAASRGAAATEQTLAADPGRAATDRTLTADTDLAAMDRTLTADTDLAATDRTMAVDPSLAATDRTMAADSALAATLMGAAKRATDDEEVPAKIGRHLVLDRLGAGAMGVVYAAYDPELDRRLAIKVLVTTRTGGEDASAARQRIGREAQAMARVTHPNVVQIFDVGSFGDRIYLAMELIDGETLGAWLARERRSLPEIVDAFTQAGRGLAAAHAAGLVHRDFKP